MDGALYDGRVGNVLTVLSKTEKHMVGVNYITQTD